MTQPQWTLTDAVLRAEDPAEGGSAGPVIEGMAVPYGHVWDSPSGYRETFAPAAFREEVSRWMGREDGARLPFLTDHSPGQPRLFLGGVTHLQETPEGVRFRAELQDTPAAHEYANQVRAGANGVSVEFVPTRSGKSRDGVMIHKLARLAAIAGALTPAYDAARVAARSEEAMDTRETPEPTPPTEPEPTPPPKEPEAPSTALSAERRSAEGAALRTVHPVQVTRPEFIYGPRSEHGFLSDAYAAWTGDTGARERQDRHYSLLQDTVEEVYGRAGDVLSSEIGGSYPSENLPGLLIERILKMRPLGSFYDRFVIADARPRIYPKVTTSTTVSVQSAEGVNPAASDFATTPTTITPLFYGGETSVSRQTLDGSNPEAESMLMNDLMEAYAQTSETAIKVVVEAGAVDQAVTLTAATPHVGLVDLVIAHQVQRFLPAQGIFLSPTLYANALKQVDSAGRLLMPWLGATNASGQQDAAAGGASVLGVPASLSWASTDGTAGVGAVALVGKRSDYAIFESAIARFTFDQGAGAPAAIRVGVWAYLATGARRGSLKETAV